MAKAVTIVAAGGVGVTNLGSLSGFGTPMTPVDAGGMAVTLLDAGGLPVVLINEDGTLWSAESLVSAIALAAGGALFNPSDLTSLYQSRTGGSNSTSGSVVGIMLDKSYMGGQTAAAYIAGRPELVVNGNFATDTNWTKAAGVTISGGAANFAAVTNSSALYQNIGATQGKWYSITYVVTRSAGTVQPQINGTSASTGAAASGTFTDVIYASGASNGNFIFVASGFTGTIDNVSVKEIPGFHAIAPSDAARPTVTVSGGLAYLIADGVDDWMNVTPTLNLGEAWWHVGGWRSDTDGTNCFSLSSEGNGRSAYSRNGTAGHWISSAPASTSIHAGNVSSIHVATIEQTSTSSLSGRYNGAAGSTITPYDDSGDTQGLALFSRRNTSWSGGIAGRFYGGAFAPGALSTENRALAERLVAQWAGVTL